MMTRTEILQHYKDFFDLNELGIAEDDQLHIDWAEALLEDANVVNKNALLADVSKRFSFKHKEPEIGAIINMCWEDGSDCQCIYEGLDNNIEPLPYAWYYS